VNQPVGQHYLADIFRQLEKLRCLAEDAVRQVNDDQLSRTPDPESNSIALILLGGPDHPGHRPGGGPGLHRLHGPAGLQGEVRRGGAGLPRVRARGGLSLQRHAAAALRTAEALVTLE